MRMRPCITVVAIVISIGLEMPAKSQKMYWTDSGTAKIQRADLNGSNIEDLVTTGLSFPSGIALDADAGKVYWADLGLDKVQRANLDGSDVEDVIIGLNNPTGLTLDLVQGKIYWTVGTVGELLRANIDGSDIETVITLNSGHISAIALDTGDSKMYFTVSAVTDNVRRANLDGSSPEPLVMEGDGGLGIAFDLVAGKMYWTPAGIVKRADLEGTLSETVVTGEGGASGIAVDPVEGKIYWTNLFSDKIHRANLDGSTVEDIVTAGLSAPRAIALDLSGRPTAVPGGTIPAQFALQQNAPNPFNPATTIHYNVPVPGGHVTLRIYDVAGRLVSTLVDHVETPGEKRVTWQGRNEHGNPVATGAYFYEMRAAGFTKARKMVLIR